MHWGAWLVSLKTFLILMLVFSITASATPKAWQDFSNVPARIFEVPELEDMGSGLSGNTIDNVSELTDIVIPGNTNVNTSFVSQPSSSVIPILKEIANRKDSLLNYSDDFSVSFGKALDNPEEFFNERVTFEFTDISTSNDVQSIPAKTIETQQDLNQSIISELSEYHETEIKIMTPTEYEELAWDFINGLWLLTVAYVNAFGSHYSTLAMQHIQENASWMGFYL